MAVQGAKVFRCCRLDDAAVVCLREKPLQFGNERRLVGCEVRSTCPLVGQGSESVNEFASRQRILTLAFARPGTFPISLGRSRSLFPTPISSSRLRNDPLCQRFAPRRELRDRRGPIGPKLVNGIADVTGFTNLFQRSSVVFKQNSSNHRSCLAGG